MPSCGREGVAFSLVLRIRPIETVWPDGGQRLPELVGSPAYLVLDGHEDGGTMALTNEYRGIHEAGHVLQIDAPDLAMERSRYR